MAATYALKTGAVIVPTELARVFLAPKGVVGATTAWAEMFYTLKNTFTLTTTQGAKSEVNIDQNTVAIASSYEANVTGFTFQVPDMAKAVADIFLNAASMVGTGEIGSDVAGDVYDTFTETSYSLTRKLITDYMVMVVYTNGAGFVITNCEMVASINKSAADPFSFTIDGTVLAGASPNETGDIIFLNPGTPAT